MNLEDEYKWLMERQAAARASASRMLGHVLEARLRRLYADMPQLTIEFLDAMGSASVTIRGRGRRPAVCGDWGADLNFPKPRECGELLGWYREQTTILDIYSEGFTIKR